MKINTRNQLGLLFREKEFADQVKPMIRKTYLEMPGYENYYNRRITVLDLFFNSEFTDFLITDKVKDIASDIRIGDDFDYSFLKRTKRYSATYLMGDKKFFRYYIDGDDLLIFVLETDDNRERIDYDFFTIDLKEGRVLEGRQKYTDIAKEFARLMIFVELSEPEINILKPKQKVGNKSRNFYNNTKLPFTVVDTSWNKVSIRTEGFEVRGHLRVQACGKEYKDRKLVWIEGYEKEGYTRRRKK